MPAVDYDQHGRTYTRHRRADPRIAARIHAALEHGHLRERDSFDGCLRLVISEQ